MIMPIIHFSMDYGTLGREAVPHQNAIFDELMSVPMHNVVQSPDDFAMEGSFVCGGNNIISQQPSEESIPSIPTQHLDITDVVSHEIAGRMKRSISKIAAHLQNQWGSSSKMMRHLRSWKRYNES